MAVSDDVMTTSRDDEKFPCTGPTSDVLPEASPQLSGECSDTGVSTLSVHKTSASPVRHKKAFAPVRPDPPRWYALRTTYGQEGKAYEYITTHGGTAFLPTITQEKTVGGKKKRVEVSRIPNIFFAHGTEKAIKAFVYDNYNLPFLRFYYKHTHIGAHIKKTPLIVPDAQIRSLQIICGLIDNDAIVMAEEISKFREGQHVRVVEGEFKGVEGIVARFRGQQRVGIVVDGVLTAATAYVPSAFLEHSEDDAK